MIKRLYNLVIKWLQSNNLYKELLENKKLKIDKETIKEVVDEFVEKSFFGSKGIIGTNPKDIEEFKICFKVNSDLVRPEFEQTSPWENATSNSMKEALDRVKKSIFDEIKLRTIKQMSEEDKKIQNIEDIRLSKNAIKILKNAEKNYISDLTSMRTEDIRILDRMGSKEEKEIIDKIHSLGLTFRNEKPILSKEQQIYNQINILKIAIYKIEQEILELKNGIVNSTRKERRILELNQIERNIQRQIELLSLELYPEEDDVELETIRTK